MYLAHLDRLRNLQKTTKGQNLCIRQYKGYGTLSISVILILLPYIMKEQYPTDDYY
jgi:hypothetical protein